MIRFACPNCCATYDVSDGDAGTKFACQTCGQRLQVPAPPRQRPAVKGPAEPPPPEPAHDTSDPSRRAFPWVAVISSGLLTIAGFALLLLASGQSPRLWPTPAHQGEAATGTADDSATTIASKANNIFKSRCYRCHGENGVAEGGFNYVLDRDKLVARKKLVPGDAERSTIYRRVAKHEMPPPDEGGPLPSGEADVLKRWIEAGAPPTQVRPDRPSFVSDEQLAALMYADLQSLTDRERRFVRYFTLTHLANAGLSADELQTYRHALAKLVNSLSWNREVVQPRPVDRAATILRIDIRDYSWSERTWRRILAAYPHGVLAETADSRALFDAAGSQLSHVRGDWFVATAARPPLYHEALALPESERALGEQLHIDVLQDVRQERVARAGFNGSGISRNNRLIERHESPYGGYWRSYDFADTHGRHNLFAHPLGPRSVADELEADGGEIIFNLPNGLHAFMLVNGQGRRLDKAPLTIVSDSRRPDRAVENGVSCMTCHARGLIPKADQVRTSVERNPNAFSATEADAIRALYPTESALKALFAKDNERFREAVERTGCKLTATEPVAALVGQYEKELDLTLAAAELGLRPGELSARLTESVVLARTLGPLNVPDGTVQRQVYNDAFPDLVRELRLGTYLRPEAATSR
jgi:mono/diheme cytochrome c family protein